jgi:predicted AlkP superfamily pyrophosphatase or phosphodiesterase
LVKVILILSDALRYDTAVAAMGYLGHLVETRLASLFKITGELPSMSRPMYETVHTGLPTHEYGIVSNQVVRRSNQPNVFELAGGYTILVSGDHGISADRSHGGTTPDVREVPLYLVRPGVAGEGDTGINLSQLQIAPPSATCSACPSLQQ